MGAQPFLHSLPSYPPAQLAAQRLLSLTIGLQFIGTHRAGNCAFVVVPEPFQLIDATPLTLWTA